MRVWRTALVLLAVGAALAPWPPAAIERFYSTLVYPAWQWRATTLSNRWGFALFDALIVVASLAWLLLVVNDSRRAKGAWLGLLARVGTRTLVWSAAFYLLFLLSWGLNYRRVPLVEKLAYNPAAVSRASARALAATAADQLNALDDQAHAQGWRTRGVIDERLADAFATTERALGAAHIALPARPKTSLFDLYFRRVGVDGMTDPYFLETLVAGGLLPFERPFVEAHEWSHLAGYADESEANFVGWLTCLRGPAPDQYSGWLFMYGELVRAVSRDDRPGVVARLGPGPRADLRAIADRLARQVSPRLSVAGWRMYDRYLKANGVEAGTASYDLVVRLALGAKFGPGWVPLLK